MVSIHTPKNANFTRRKRNIMVMTRTPASNPKLIETVTENVVEKLLPMLEQKINERFNGPAANTSPNNLSLADDLADAILAKIAPKLDELIEAKLMSLGLISRQENGLFPSFSKKDKLLSGQRFSPAVQYGQPPSYALITRMMHHAVLDTSTIAEKSKRAVIERIPEAIDADELVSDIAKKAGLEGQLLENIHRHPRVKRNDDGNGKPRILKVPFSTKIARDTFIREFRKSIMSLPNSPKNLIVRRDMTQEELKILYAIRRQAYEMNKECGLFKYVVSDLQIIELKNPKPFHQA
jgi:hypothetical protein